MKKVFFLIVFILFFALPKTAFAEVIHSFSTKVVAHKDGSMDVMEAIEYDFGFSDHHGIFRDIPLFSKVGDLYRIIKIENVRVLRDRNSEKFEVIQTKENYHIKIGDADKLITGDHLYLISYKVGNGIGSNFSDHDEIYWNATGNNWQVAIEEASINITQDFDVKQTGFLCFQGEFGSKDQTCRIENSSAVSSQILSPGSGFSAVAVYPVGTFPKSILSKTPPQTLGDKILAVITKYILYIWFFVNIVIPGYLWYWYEQHKNKKKYGAPSVNFDFPKDENGKILPPALAGTIDSAKLERDDVTATIFDLAIRKYLKISENKEKRSLRPDKTTQVVTKLKDTDSALYPFEKSLLDRLFRDGDSVEIDNLKKDFYKTFETLENEIFSSLIEKGYYIKNPKIQKAGLLVFGIIILSFGMFILGAALIVFSAKLNGRTALGDEMDYKIDGLKLFLKSMDRNYKWQAEKFYTVEHMIPYAMALGYIDHFMEALKILKPDYNPTWYSGTNFYLSYAAFSTVAASSFTTSAPSSSSGSGGGGFSGGGGGGGGGGSW